MIVRVLKIPTVITHMSDIQPSVNPCFGIITAPTVPITITPLLPSTIRKTERSFGLTVSSDRVREVRAGVILIDQNGFILCVKQARPTHNKHATTARECNWGFPKGRVSRQDFGNIADASIMPPEDVMIKCALRELREETGVIVDPRTFISKPQDSRAAHNTRSANWQYLTINDKSDKMFMCAITARPQVQVDNDEISEHAWMTLHELSSKQHSIFTANIIKHLRDTRAKHPHLVPCLSTYNHRQCVSPYRDHALIMSDSKWKLTNAQKVKHSGTS